MTDLEMIRLCAEAMGYEIVSDDPNWTGDPARTDVAHPPGTIMIRSSRVYPHTYAPLHNDAQAMALVKRFGLSIRKIDTWQAWIPLQPADGESVDLNRAIVECVAKMQVEK